MSEADELSRKIGLALCNRLCPQPVTKDGIVQNLRVKNYLELPSQNLPVQPPLHGLFVEHLHSCLEFEPLQSNCLTGHSFTDICLLGQHVGL